MSLAPKNQDLIGIIDRLEKKVSELEFLVSRQNFDTGTGIPGPTGAQGLTGPAGPQGSSGPAATINIGTVTTVASGVPASVTNAGSTSNAILNFSIPKGETPTVSAGTVTSVLYGDPPTVTNSGTTYAAVFDFEIPAGPPGIQGTSGNDLVGARVIFLS